MTNCLPTVKGSCGNGNICKPVDYNNGQCIGYNNQIEEGGVKNVEIYSLEDGKIMILGNKPFVEIIKQALEYEYKFHRDARKRLPDNLKYMIPKLHENNFYKDKDKWIFYVVMENAENGGFKPLAYCKFEGKIFNSFINMHESYPCPYSLVDDTLYGFFKNHVIEESEEKNKYYSRLLNPKYFRECLEEWYIETNQQLFFKDFFIQLFNLHRYNIFHNDLHSHNIWYNETTKKYKFIDFGLSTTITDAYNDNSIPYVRENVHFGDNDELGFMKYFTGKIPEKLEPRLNIRSLFSNGDDIFNRTKQKIDGTHSGFTKDELEFMMTLEIIKPVTVNDKVNKYKIFFFQFFNLDIMDNYINEYIMTKYNSDSLEGTIIDHIFNLTISLFDTYVNFFANKYAETVINCQANLNT